MRDNPNPLADALEFVSSLLIVGSLVGMLILSLGCTSMLNKDQKQADPTMQEMTIPQNFRITNAPPPIF